jgi:phosphotransferase system enzyme I (PtsI)
MEGDTAAVVCLRGTPVSPGLARGRLVVLADENLLPPRERGSVAEESKGMHAAIASASAELAALTQRAGDADAQAILAFQVAMLDDPIVTKPAFAAIEAGVAAEQAWRTAMDLQIRTYH